MPDRKEPNDATMKAAEEIQAEHDKVIRGEKICVGYKTIAQIIEDATHLSEKEKALRECHAFLASFIDIPPNEIDVANTQSWAAKTMTKVWEALNP